MERERKEADVDLILGRASDNYSVTGSLNKSNHMLQIRTHYYDSLLLGQSPLRILYGMSYIKRLFSGGKTTKIPLPEIFIGQGDRMMMAEHCSNYLFHSAMDLRM